MPNTALVPESGDLGKGDYLRIMAFEKADDPMDPQMILVDREN